MANPMEIVTYFLWLQVERNVGFLPLGLWSQQSIVLVEKFLDMETEADRGL